MSAKGCHYSLPRRCDGLVRPFSPWARAEDGWRSHVPPFLGRDRRRHSVPPKRAVPRATLAGRDPTASSPLALTSTRVCTASVGCLLQTTVQTRANSGLLRPTPAGRAVIPGPPTRLYDCPDAHRPWLDQSPARPVDPALAERTHAPARSGRLSRAAPSVRESGGSGPSGAEAELEPDRAARTARLRRGPVRRRSSGREARGDARSPARGPGALGRERSSPAADRRPRPEERAAAGAVSGSLLGNHQTGSPATTLEVRAAAPTTSEPTTTHAVLRPPKVARGRRRSRVRLPGADRDLPTRLPEVETGRVRPADRRCAGRCAAAAGRAAAARAGSRPGSSCHPRKPCSSSSSRTRLPGRRGSDRSSRWISSRNRSSFDGRGGRR